MRDGAPYRRRSRILQAALARACDDGFLLEEFVSPFLVNARRRSYITNTSCRARSCVMLADWSENGPFRLRFPRRTVSQPTKSAHDACHVSAVCHGGGRDPLRGRDAPGNGVPGNLPRGERAAVRFRRDPPPV